MAEVGRGASSVVRVDLTGVTGIDHASPVPKYFQLREILLDLFNTVPPTPEQARLTALAANAAGDVADSYFYMSEYHLMSGDLPLAMNQLQLALAVPKISEVQRARFEARLEEVQQALPKRVARQRQMEESRRRFD